MAMHAADWSIVTVLLAVIALVAWRGNRYLRDITDFLAAGRRAGRYLLCTASAEASLGVISIVAGFEEFQQAGFALGWWKKLTMPVGMLLGLTGFVIYRYRETRALTLAQFFETRYSRRFRIFTGLLMFISGVINYGIFPAVAARFFVYFCGFPPELSIMGLAVPTYALLMALYLGAALLLTLAGGQLTILITDGLEGLIAGVIYLVVAAALLWMFPWPDIAAAMSMRPAGQSMLNPFETSQVRDFNIWFVLIGVIISVYGYRSWQGTQGYNASAASPHEAKMGGILGNWRIYARSLMFTLLGACAFTFLNHPHYQQQAAAVAQSLASIDDPHLQQQMRIPTALGHILPLGIRGLFCASMFYTLLACDGSYMHSWGSIFIQDVVLPFRRKPLTPKQHIRFLRLGIVGVAIFAFIFSLLFRQTDYILMFFAVTGTIYTGGAGAVLLGGLYWKRGTAAGAWTAMIVGATLSLSSIAVQQWWMHIGPALAGLVNSPALDDFVQANPQRFPVNGQWLALFSVLCALSSYIIVSLLTCRTPVNMDKLLHRGAYAVETKGADAPPAPRARWGRLIGFDNNFTRGDKWISASVFWYGMIWFAVILISTFWNLASPWPLSWWSRFWHVYLIVLPAIIGVVTTIWFTYGGTRDLLALFRAMRKEQHTAALQQSTDPAAVNAAS